MELDFAYIGIALVSGFASAVSTAAVIKTDIRWIKEKLRDNRDCIRRVEHRFNEHVKTGH